jgi:glycosyltransferase involved in cell wall biosynthesis
MINVLHLIDQYHIGGPGKTILNTAKFIERNKFAIHVGAFLHPGQETELSKEVTRNGIDLLALKDIRGISIENLKSILRYIDMKKISIFHGHGYKADIYGVLLKILRKNVTVVTTHHGWIRNTRSQLAFGKLARIGSALFDHTIIVSNEMMRHLPRTTVKKKRYSVIHNAIVATDYEATGTREKQRALLGVEPNEIMLLSVGRLSKEKGCNNLLKAFEIAQKHYNNVKLVYVGDGPLVDELKGQIIRSNLKENALLCGHHQNVQPYYEAADIFICPSDTEGLSNAILEAMAFSIPVIATDVGGNPEIIVHQVNGLLVPPQNIVALKEAICLLLSNSSMRRKLGQSGYETIVGEFSFEQRTSKIESLYIRLVIGKNVQRAKRGGNA